MQVDGIAFSTFVIPLLFFNSAIPLFSILPHYFLLKTRSLHREPTPRLLAGISLEHVESYLYIGILVTSGLTWFDHIGQIFTKDRKLVDMMYRLFYS